MLKRGYLKFTRFKTYIPVSGAHKFKQLDLERKQGREGGREVGKKEGKKEGRRRTREEGRGRKGNNGQNENREKERNFCVCQRQCESRCPI